MKYPVGTVYIKQVTATADTPFQIELAGLEDDVVLSSVNIHCYTNDAYMGNAGYQQAVIRANAVIWFDGVIRVSDLWFKNYTAGSNTAIVLCGIVR